MSLSRQTDRSITVIIPTYNRSLELARALDGLAAQTDPDFDVVVCDDGSTEDISGVTALYASRLRLQLLRIPNSGGPARPRNIATSAARTRWISYLDSDDWWFADRMRRVKMALNDDDDIVYHQLRVERANRGGSDVLAHGAILGEALRTADPVLHMIRFGNPMPNSATTVRRELMQGIGGFDESRNLASVEDFDAWLRLAVRGARLRILPEVLGAYWVGADQISVFNQQQYERQRNLFRRQQELLPLHYRALATSHFNYLLGSYALDLGIPGSIEHFRLVDPTHTPRLWVKVQIKLLRSFLRKAI